MSVALPASPSPSTRGFASVLKVAAVGLAGASLGLFIAAGVVLLLMTQLFNYHVVTIRSDSMEPAYSRGDVVLTQPVSMGKVSQGDVILFNEANTGVPFVHRVVAVQEYRQNLRDGTSGQLLETRSEFQFLTRGDANEQADGGTVSEAQYRGRVAASLPTGAWFGGNISVGTMLTVLAAVLGLAWIAWEVTARISRRRARDHGQGGQA